MPACRKTPAEAAASRYHTASRCWMPAASEIIDFDTKPDVRGNDDIDSAPTIPQIVVSGMVRNNPPAFVDVMARASQLGRLADPDEMVGPALLLTSDAGSFITGQVLLVDGGMVPH